MDELSTSQCVWEHDEHDECWNTGCGGTHIIIDGSPVANDMLFCCYCAKPIKEIVWPTH